MDSVLRNPRINKPESSGNQHFVKGGQRKKKTFQNPGWAEGAAGEILGLFATSNVCVYVSS